VGQNNTAVPEVEPLGLDAKKLECTWESYRIAHSGEMEATGSESYIVACRGTTRAAN